MHRAVIELAPLQTYVAALLFSPQASVIRNLYQEKTSWIRVVSGVEYTWSLNLQTLEGHLGSVNTVAFSPDGSKLASGSYDNTIRVWDVASGQVNHTLEGHLGSVNSAFFLVSKNTSDLGAHPGAVQRHTKEHHVLSVDESRQWLTQSGLRLLYLPVDHRPGEIAVQGNTLAIGSNGGRVTIISTYIV